jgi:hypothetical protein
LKLNPQRSQSRKSHSRRPKLLPAKASGNSFGETAAGVVDVVDEVVARRHLLRHRHYPRQAAQPGKPAKPKHRLKPRARL